MELSTTGEPPKGWQGHGRRPRVEKGGQTDAVNGGRFKHVAQGAEYIGGGWRVAAVDDAQVDGVLVWERRWGAGERERDDMTRNGYLWGCNRIEEGNRSI